MRTPSNTVTTNPLPPNTPTGVVAQAYYRVLAHNAGGSSAWSTVSIKTLRR